jgi:hypothetical protein
MKHHKTNQGYVLLLAVLVTSVILAISFGVYAIGLKAVVLSVYIKDSQRALAAADRGVECALYWDNQFRNNTINASIFATPAPFVLPGNANQATCAGRTITNAGAVSGGGTAWQQFTTPVEGHSLFTLQFSDNTCVNVAVSKTSSETVYTADGLSDCNDQNLRRTQRTIQVNTVSGGASASGPTCPYTPQANRLIINVFDPTATYFPGLDNDITVTGYNGLVPFSAPGKDFGEPGIRSDTNDNSDRVVVYYAIPPGTYTVRMATYDAFAGRSSAPVEPMEQGIFVPLDPLGNHLVHSLPSDDLFDGVDAATGDTQVGTPLVVPPGSDHFKIWHNYKDQFGAPSLIPNKFIPVCVALDS